MKPRITRAPAPVGVWPVDRILVALRHARWGVLQGRTWHGVCAVLAALVDVARKQKSVVRGQVTTTAWQLAGATNYSEKWVRQCLQELEYARIIRWSRGEVGNRRLGQPDPSIITIQRKPLMAILADARQTASREEHEHALTTARRLLKIRSGRAKSKPPRHAGEDQPELSGSLPPHGEASTDAAPPGGVEQPTLEATMAAAGLHVARTTAPAAPSPDDTGPPGDADPPLVAQAKAMIRAQLRNSRARWAHHSTEVTHA